ncbi:MAG TPA: ABC transporter permease [Actinomycetota bacterium]|nr:ABC transporter permease [Actinomycetota bacterium]
MGRYLIRRSLFLVLVLFVVSLITFLIFVKLPAADPARRAAGKATTPENIRAAREAFGLDQPVWVQYARFAQGLVPWPGMFLNEDVYFSYSNFVPVKEEIYKRLPVSIALAVGASLLWLAVGIPIGIVSAVRRGGIADRAGMAFALFGVSTPVFWLAYLLLYVFWYKLHWAPSSGIPIGTSVLEAVLQGRFILPWVVVSLTYAAFYARMVRGNLVETMNEDYIRTARAKGLSERRVIYRHGLRGALTPVVTMFGIDIAGVLAGSFITETVFNLPGIGQYAVRSIFINDFPSVMGVTIFGAFFIAIGNLLVDIAYAYVDPRVRF